MTHVPASTLFVGTPAYPPNIDSLARGTHACRYACRIAGRPFSSQLFVRPPLLLGLPLLPPPLPRRITPRDPSLAISSRRGRVAREQLSSPKGKGSRDYLELIDRECGRTFVIAFHVASRRRCREEYQFFFFPSELPARSSTRTLVHGLSLSLSLAPFSYGALEFYMRRACHAGCIVLHETCNFYIATNVFSVRREDSTRLPERRGYPRSSFRGFH